MAIPPNYIVPYLPHPLERNVTIMGAGQAHLEERHLTRGNGSYHDDQNLTPLHYGYAYHNGDLRCAVPALSSQDRIMYPPLYHYYDDLDLLELGRHGRFQEPGPPPHDAADEELEFGGRGRRRYRDPLSPDAANEKLMFGWRGHCPNRDPLPYDVADAGMEYGPRGRRPYSIPPPYDTANDGFISDDGRRGRVHRHSFGSHWPPFASGDTGIDELDGGPFRQIYLGPRNPRSRSKLREDHDLGSDHLGSLEPHLRRRLEPRLDDYISDPNMAMRGPHYDLVRAGIPPAARCSTGHPFEANFENYASETNFREAHARRPLKPRATGQRSELDFRPVHQDVWNPRAAELMGPSCDVRKHDGIVGEGRLQEPQKESHGAGYPGREPPIEHSRPVRQDRRRQRPRVARSRPVARLFGSDLEEPPRGRRDLSFPPHHSRNRTCSPRTKRTHPPVAADPTGKGTASDVPPTQQHTQTPVSHAKHKVTARKSDAGPINASNRPDITPIPERAAPETPSNIALLSQAESGDNDRSESSSNSGCYTPDADSDVAVGGGRRDGVQGADVLQTFVHIEL